MKKTLATLLILTLAASVCGMIFASAADPVEELKAELETLVGPDADAAVLEWVIDVETDETGLVTATITVANVVGKNVGHVAGHFYYDVNELTLLNTVNSDNSLDCVTACPAGFENLSLLEQDFNNVIVPGVIRLDATNANDANSISEEEPLVFTLKFQMAEGVTLAGMYITTESAEFADVEFNYISGNGGYGIAMLPVKEESSEAPSVEPSDDPSVESSEESSEIPSEEPSEEPSVEPSEEPSEEPSVEPSEEPSEEPSVEPSEEPSEEPSVEPSEEPSVEPSVAPSEDESSEAPQPGDAGILLFAVLGVLAVAGAVVAIKVRG